MSKFHSLPEVAASKGRRGTITYPLRSTPSSLVIFVHGFGGSANDTWNEFPQLLDNFDSSDVIFYDYDSLHVQTTVSANNFFTFLDEIIGKGPKLSFGNRAFKGYKKIVLVAHSLGSIVVRLALIEANKAKRKWLPRCKMTLFAPAHRGARVQNLAMECLSGFGKVLGGIARFNFPTIDELMPESYVIQDLVKDTERLQAKRAGGFTIAHKVIWAEKEKVVHNRDFCKDPRADIEAGKNHINVCKPNDRYWNPLKYVTETLQA
jgi:pimeloyl-ACP methyl ester carboxylesterase